MQSLEEQLKQVSECGDAVWDCPERKRLLKVNNTWQPQTYGVFAYKPQCLKCGRIGTAKTNVSTSSLEVTTEDGSSLRDALKARRKILGAALREEYERRRVLEQQQWRDRYDEHLKSDFWRKIRARVLSRDGQICQSCLIATATEVHHLTYERMGFEAAFDLVSVCRTCHARLHSSIQ